MVGFTPGGMYHEAAFRYLLDTEAKRSQRSGLSSYLLVVYQQTGMGAIEPMRSQAVAPVVAVLSRCLRETDYIGWFREGLIVGGVLTAIGKDSSADHLRSLKARIEETLRAELGAKESGSLLVRIGSYDDLAGGIDERVRGRMRDH